MNTKITLSTGEKIIVEGHVDDFKKSLHNQMGVFVNQLKEVDANTYINTSQIAKIEKG